MGGNGVAVKPDLQLRNVGLRLDLEVDHTRHLVHHPPDPARQRAQGQKVRSEQLDGDRGSCPREHVVDPMADRLTDAEDRTRDH